MTTVQIQGMAELNAKILALKANFDGPPVRRLCLKAARVIANAVRANIKRGPTGNLQRAVQVATGRKAWKQGALALARINAWKAPHAHLIEEGTQAFAGQAMKIPLANVSPEWWAALPQAQKIEAGKRGYVFISKREGLKAQHPFARAVEAKLPEAQKIIVDGCRQLVQDSIK